MDERKKRKTPVNLFSKNERNFKCYKKALRLVDCYRSERIYKIEVHQ